MSSQSNQRGSGLVFQSGALDAAPAVPEPEIQGLIHNLECELDITIKVALELAKRLEPIYREVPTAVPTEGQPATGFSPIGDFINAQVIKARGLQYALHTMIEKLAI